MIRPTSAQLQIRDAPELDLLVSAPAGCGKTEAIALRVAGLLLRGQVRAPRRALVTTFSNRARDNVKARLRSYVDAAIMRDRVVVANFHGLSARIYQAHANVVGLDADVAIPESDWVGEQCRSRNLSFARFGAVQDLLRTIKQQPVDDAAVDRHLVAAGDDVALELERLRKSELRLTYDDLPRIAELILQNDMVADLYRSHFACVVVDEFQDLTPQQLRIVNRIGYGRTTYAGDIAQGIYGFAGAVPDATLAEIRAECSRTVMFNESHRSSPTVLNMVNAVARRIGGSELACADPGSWPHGGLAGRIAFGTTGAEANWIVKLATAILRKAPGQRIGIIARTGSRRRFIDGAFDDSDVPTHRWEDGVLDTDTGSAIAAMLDGLDETTCLAAADPIAFLRGVAGFDKIQDPSTRESLADALGWCCDLLRDGISADEVRSRIRVGDGTTLLDAAGVHLLTGHIGKGQQFDWVIIPGTEDGCIPDFRANTSEALREEARILGVMISRARHGVLLSRSGSVESLAGAAWPKQASPFLADFNNVETCRDLNDVVAWLQDADWDAIQRR